MRYLLFTWSLLICSFGIHAAQCPPGDTAPCAFSEARVLPSGIAYRLELRETELNADIYGRRFPSGFWGADGNYPETQVVALTLVLDNTEIGIPAKIYTDLGNIKGAEIRENKNAVVLVLHGGEAQAEFYATYVFIDGVVRKRTVRSRLQPDRIWEKTSFNAPNP
jgi:hypothetical protein